jgi:AAA family ATP:ADP antiporter
VRLQPLYIDLFRRTILQNSAREAYPELDVSSLETLLTSLDSDSDEEVLAALRILEHENKVHLVPALILYHPDEEVVISALRLFAQTGRKVALHAIGHLDAHPSQRIRAEAIAARAVLDPDAEHLAERLEHEQSPEARAAIYATMASFEMLEESDARKALLAIAAGDSATSKVVVAEVVAWRGAVRFEDVIIELTRSREVDVRRAAIGALGTLRGPLGSDTLVDLLADPASAPDARAALIASGELGSRALERALSDKERLRSVRRQVPTALASADPERAIGVLLEHLHDEGDGMVRYRSILALQAIVDVNPDFVIAPKLLDKEISGTVSRAYRYIDRLVTLERGAEKEPTRRTPGHRLLVDLLRDKERNAVGRLFRLLALAFPNQDFGAIYRSIESGRKGYKASAVELIQNLLKAPLRSSVVGLVDDVEDSQRLTQAQPYHAPLGLTYDEAIAHTLESKSQVVRDLAAYHIGELGLISLLPRVSELARTDKENADLERTRRILVRLESRAPMSDAVGLVEVSDAG